MLSLHRNAFLGILLLALGGCGSNEASCDGTGTLDALTKYIKVGNWASLAEAAQREFGGGVSDRLKGEFDGQLSELAKVRSGVSDLESHQALLKSKLQASHQSCLQALSVNFENNLMCLSVERELDVPFRAGNMVEGLQETIDYMMADSSFTGSQTQKEVAAKLYPQYLEIAKDADESKRKLLELQVQAASMESQIESSFRDAVSQDWAKNLENGSLSVTDVRIESVDKDAKRVSCAAKAHISIPQWGNVDTNISYTAQMTTDGKVFIEVK